MIPVKGLRDDTIVTRVFFFRNFCHSLQRRILIHVSTLLILFFFEDIILENSIKFHLQEKNSYNFHDTGLSVVSK